MKGQAAVGCLLALLAAPVGAGEPPAVVATKPFAESYLLGELFAQLLEARGLAVDRRPGLGATEIAFRALVAGEIDVYPEYTGTGLLAILGEAPRGDGGEAYRRVAQVFRQRWGVRWLPPLGFENTYAIAVRPDTAREHGLATLGDLARAAPRLVAGLSPDFIGRADGLVGLRATYGLAPRAVRALMPAVKYQALAAGEVDFVDGYSTDGAMAGRLDVERMRALNRRVEVDGDAVADVARDALRDLGLVGAEPAAAGRAEVARDGSLAAYLWNGRDETLRRARRHLLLVGLSLLAGIAFAVPLGLALERTRSVAEAVIGALGVLQTVPGIALLAFTIPLLGIGLVPAVTALFLYSLFPIVRSTYTGVRDADPAAVASARALGMTEAQLLTRVRLPLAAPVVMAGVRTAAVIGVGTATLAAFIGAGGLGDPIVAGLALSDTRMILSGAIPAALLALALDALLAAVERAVTPRGLA